jgi:hypothetical protein
VLLEQRLVDLHLVAEHQFFALGARLHLLRGELRLRRNERDVGREHEVRQRVEHHPRLGAVGDTAGLLGGKEDRHVHVG